MHNKKLPREAMQHMRICESAPYWSASAVSISALEAHVQHNLAHVVLKAVGVVQTQTQLVHPPQTRRKNIKIWTLYGKKKSAIDSKCVKSDTTRLVIQKTHIQRIRVLISSSNALCHAMHARNTKVKLFFKHIVTVALRYLQGIGIRVACEKQKSTYN